MHKSFIILHGFQSFGNYTVIGEIASFCPIPEGSRVDFRSIPFRVRAKETENQSSKPSGCVVTFFAGFRVKRRKGPCDSQKPTMQIYRSNIP